MLKAQCSISWALHLEQRCQTWVHWLTDNIHLQLQCGILLEGLNKEHVPFIAETIKALYILIFFAFGGISQNCLSAEKKGILSAPWEEKKKTQQHFLTQNHTSAPPDIPSVSGVGSALCCRSSRIGDAAARLPLLAHFQFPPVRFVSTEAAAEKPVPYGKVGCGKWTDCCRGSPA